MHRSRVVLPLIQKAWGLFGYNQRASLLRIELMVTLHLRLLSR